MGIVVVVVVVVVATSLLTFIGLQLDLVVPSSQNAMPNKLPELSGFQMTVLFVKVYSNDGFPEQSSDSNISIIPVGHSVTEQEQ